MISEQNDDSGWVCQHRSNTVVIGSGGFNNETKNKYMNINFIEKYWARVANKVEDILKETRDEYVSKRTIRQKDENGNFIGDNYVELGREYHIAQLISSDDNFRMKFEWCLEKFFDNDKDDDEPRDKTASWVQCDLCSYRWIAVRPIVAEKLECPNCRNTGNFENV